MRGNSAHLETMMANATKQTQPAAVSVTFHDASGKEVRIDEAPTNMKLTYADGVVMWCDRQDLDRMPIWQSCAWHGLKQKLIDAAAISRDPATGKAATVGVKRACVDEVWERLTRGEWFKNRGDGTGSGGLLYRALVRFFEGRKTPEEVRAWLDTQSDAAQQQLRVNPKIATIIAELRPVKDAGDFDADAALEQFGGEGE